MVSFEALFSPDMRKPTADQFENSPKKRKLDDDEPTEREESLEKRSKSETTKSLFDDMELHLETPLPLEWQRCLDIQSGEIHFYNTRTHARTCKDPRRSPDHEPLNHMCLDLELNLPCDSSERKINMTDHNHQFNKHNSVSPTSGSSSVVVDDKKIRSSGGGLTPPSGAALSWLAVEEEEQQQQEMVATVCMRCHMLVMLCKSSPACPNCKFMHPPDQAPPKLFKPRLSLLC